MAHNEQRLFFELIRSVFPEKFTNVNVLDVGSLDINGNNRHLFMNANYTGIDIISGNNVDVVCKVHEFYPGIQYDVVISSEMFEHDCHYKESLQRCYDLTKPGGVLLISCAADGRPEHGTIKTTTEDSPATNDYYMNLNIDIFIDILNPEKNFTKYCIHQTSEFPQDLYFYGVKN